MLHTKHQTRRACLLLALCVALLYVPSSEARSDPSLFWATVTTALPVVPSDTPTMAPVSTSNAPVADLMPTAAPEVTATPVDTTAPAVNATPAPTPVPAPAPVIDSPTSAPVINVPASSVDGGPITTATDLGKDFGPMAGGGARPTSPPAVPAPAPTLETPAPATNETPAPPAETTTPVTDPVPAPVVEGSAPSEAPVNETEAPAPSVAAINPEKDFGPMTGGGTRPTFPPVVTPAPTPETSAAIAETQAPPADIVTPSTDPVPDSVAEGSIPNEAPTSNEMVVDTGSLPPLETDPIVGTSDDGVTDGVTENADPEPAIDEPIEAAPVITDTDDTLDTSETVTEGGQADETSTPPVAESSAAEPLPPANAPEPQPSSNSVIRAPAPQILPPPRVVTGTASDGSLTSTVIFNGANISTPHS